ncbi:MbtH family protein [Rathayibacter rathayi]|uniref:MbtH family protein n=1 Tax=Rathayibacter rathayi TaxID=33887 RepID=A0ABD6WAH3_RATRA|nr:MbtH family protein [Rathayibacter rathayi]AZZ48548.1 MbtH family protein [Rathayibacter rathayi]MWV74859.1 MbtH family NRPS accessory protein [Rathayibacter rathayi NCPPB 2980 = VKM Ac-1601]PPF14728.1 MbtH family protein [Rathayibacter rathayi]PPF24405.1 MbtH family protein [Rathayibacter rathayi]PPF49957.1 MbtH family protein [Rathayibacter rathayi]
MSDNPFDDESGRFLVLINAEDQHSLWPIFAPVPGGWSIAYGGQHGADRAECLAFVEANWTDLRPRSLRAAQDATP